MRHGSVAKAQALTFFNRMCESKERARPETRRGVESVSVCRMEQGGAERDTADSGAEYLSASFRSHIAMRT